MKTWNSRTPWNKIALISFAVAMLSCFALPAVRAMETDCVIHDPSTVIKSGGTYWVFGTGTGISVYSSKDRRHWTPEPPVFETAPAWIAAAVPGNTQRSYWAPDIRHVGGRFLLYYSVSTFGSNTSAIGLATSPTLQPPHWTDQGIVIQSSRQNNYNTIDPCVVSDAHGGLWLSFGSFWSGIKMVALDPKTGKPASQNPAIYSIASHPQDRADSIEASCISTHNGYYYLFVDWDYCCRGPQSTYNIRVGRSRSITGPYLDQTGHDMQSGGGTLFLPATLNDAGGISEVGPGHAGLLSDTDGDWFTCHYEWAKDHDGRPMLNLQKLTWGKDGWPALENTP
jgi:arabinan endo-1,5-alpha-L-arabinosidase